MYLYNATAITVAAPVQIGNPVGMVVAAAAGVHRNLLAKHTHPSTAKTATDPALRGGSFDLSEGIKRSDRLGSCPVWFLQSEPTECRMSRRNRAAERPTGEPTVTSWSALLN